GGEGGGEVRVVDVSQVNDNAQTQKALKRLQVDKAPTSLSQLVMWRLAAGLDWNTISQYSQKWANGHELTLAKEFVDHLDALPDGETGRVLFEFDGADAASQPIVAEIPKPTAGRMVWGLTARVGPIPARPQGPAVACRVKVNASEALVQVTSSDASARNWVPFGKFTVPVTQTKEKFDVGQFADGLADGV